MIEFATSSSDATFVLMNAVGIGAEFFGQRMTAVLVDVGDDDACAFLDELPYRAFANAAGTAGDDRYLPVQVAHGVTLSFLLKVGLYRRYAHFTSGGTGHSIRPER